MCFRSASGCSADRLMSRSRMARIRGQSVLEILEEDRFFISRRLPKRDQVNLRRCFGMHDGYGDSSKQAKRDKALFVVREAIVLESESRPPRILWVRQRSPAHAPSGCDDVSFHPRKTA